MTHTHIHPVAARSGWFHRASRFARAGHWAIRHHLHCLFAVRWQRFQSRIAATYHQRVTVPVLFWVACGCVPEWRPHIPAWQPLAYAWLACTWQRPSFHVSRPRHIA